VLPYNHVMSTPHCRLLPFAPRPGPENMAADEVMLEAVGRGLASLRFYTWSEPTLSLGYFQAAAQRLVDPRLAGVAWVRRPSGGAAILHHHELTYCLALPAGPPWQTKANWICRAHEFIATALQSLGASSQPVGCGEERKLGEFLCFLHQTPGDLLMSDCKIAGSAQRKARGALMQHGSILLAQSPHAPALPGIAECGRVHVIAEELAGRIAATWQRALSWELAPADFTVDESRRIAEIAAEKFRSAGWNEKR
jgi:lipoyl(octanoyl) transferase